MSLIRFTSNIYSSVDKLVLSSCFDRVKFSFLPRLETPRDSVNDGSNWLLESEEHWDLEEIDEFDYEYSSTQYDIEYFKIFLDEDDEFNDEDSDWMEQISRLSHSMN